ncbi:hypothetical protein, partial [Salmonella sp. SAL04284]|uniref:hypothetical protein n=1 Tax=Salmonella sp. SAL04284 TaxID=3159862 RepID=UPI00397A4718
MSQVVLSRLTPGAGHLSPRSASATANTAGFRRARMKEPRTQAGLLLAVRPLASGDADTVLAALRQVHQ